MSGLSGLAVFAQDTDSDIDDEIYELSPFEVSTEGDRGYYASNTISGSRINIALQDVPMPIEVITSEFMEDTGATDLRESLRYSAGIVLDSQNDAGAGLDDVPGGVHNGSGATAAITNTTIKMRGFVTESALRKGYRRQHSSDSINIDRVEVVRGPAALLYGIGNFGGVVNYLPKRPMETAQTVVTAEIGSNSSYRATVDHTAPISDKLGYRVTASFDDAEHWTDVQNSQGWFVSPVLEYRPTDKTKITLDIEVGSDETYGTGFQQMRARGDLSGSNSAINEQDRLQKAGFVIFDGIDGRTFRLSGPDTYVKADAVNFNIEATHEIFDGLNVLAGYNYSKVDFWTRDIVNNAYQSGVGPEGLRGTINVQPFEAANGDPVFDGEIFNTSAGEDDRVLNDAILTYMWQATHSNRDRKELRAELTYNFQLLEESRFFNMDHLFLVGYSKLKSEIDEIRRVTGAGTDDGFLWKDPNDHSLIRFGQGIIDNGTPNGVAGFPELLPNYYSANEAKNRGLYGVWQGRFWDERITLIYGRRKDTAEQSVVDWDFNTEGGVTGTDLTEAEEQSNNTEQMGVSIEVVDGISVFALQSEGLEPNFDGLRDGYGQPLGATTAESKEIGIKLNFLDGRVSATFSTYEIEVNGPGQTLFWTPAPGKGLYDPNRPTVYDITNIIATNNAHAASMAQYDAAVASGDVFTDGGNTYITVLDGNGNDTTGAAYLDSIFAWGSQNGWPGWLYNSSVVTDSNANNAAMDWASPLPNSYQASLESTEKSRGWEGQVLLTPIDNWQILLNYAYTRREIVRQGVFPKYPYPQDRWAIWYFPDGNWGLQGVSLNEAYADPSDTSTWTGGPASTNGESLDDTPMHDLSFWTSYSFEEGRLEGLKLGFGGSFQSKREYLSGFTVGGNAVTDENGNRIKLFTDPREEFNFMARYDFDIGERPAWLQLNVDNLTNDEDLYGYVYAPGRSWRLQFGTNF